MGPRQLQACAWEFFRGSHESSNLLPVPRCSSAKQNSLNVGMQCVQGSSESLRVPKALDLQTVESELGADTQVHGSGAACVAAS